MCRITEDLFAFGNASGPRGPRLQDFGIGNPTDIVGPLTPDPVTRAVNGASTYTDPAIAPLTGHYWKVATNTPLSQGSAVSADGSDIPGGTAPAGHRTIYPAAAMTFEQFRADFLALPWKLAGKKTAEVLHAMEGSSARPGSLNSWEGAMDAAEALARAATAAADQPDLLHAGLRASLRGAVRREGSLALLGALDYEHTAHLLPELVELALSHRDASKVRQLLGRLPASYARTAVPGAVEDQLRRTPDDDAHRRMAELLVHLGLDQALARLVEAAGNNPDPHVREVAADFGG